MTHLEEHPHAFIAGGIVVLVAVFAEHDEVLIDQVRQVHNADLAVCCCNVDQVPAVDWTWNGERFIEPEQ